jgi:hypothetical protein
MEVKATIRALLDRLPDDCTIDDVLYHIYVLQEISHGLRDVDEGKTTPHEVVRERLRQKWLIGNVSSHSFTARGYSTSSNGDR